MAIKIYEQFAPFANPADGDHPYGSIKNDSIPGAEDGTPLDAIWGNDMVGFTDALLAEAGVVPSGQPDTVGSSQRLEAIKKIAGNIRGNDGVRHFSIGAIPQCNDSGVFELIDNSSHNPMNVSGVSQPDQYTIRITYNQEAAKINSFIATPDAELAPFGVVCGGDVGTSFANIQCYAPFEFLADNNSPTPSINLNALWQPSIASGSITVTRLSESTLRVTHPPVTTNAPPVVSPVNSANSSRFVVSFGDTVTDVVCVGNAKGYVGYSGTVWEQFFSNNVTPPIMTWTVNNTLRIDHGVPYGGSGVPQVTPQGGALNIAAVEYGSTYFEIAFFDYAGTKILSPSVDMKFWYVLDGLTLPSKWPIGNLVSVSRGLCHVPSYNFKGVAGNNLWVSGDFEKFN